MSEKVKRDLVFADVHGMFWMLQQALERAKYDPASDRLIFLGDVFDRGPDIKKSVEFLMSTESIICIRGNHDQSTLDWLLSGDMRNGDLNYWLYEGGYATVQSAPDDETKHFYTDYINRTQPYFLDKNRLYVHGGLPTGKELNACEPSALMWDRTMVQTAYRESIFNTDVTPYDMVFCGHTPTLFIGPGTHLPTRYSNVFMCDTGAFYGNRMSVIDPDTLEFWQSDYLRPPV